MNYDVLVIGGGPAGLQSAMMLARMRRSVLVCDSSEPRNAAAKEMHHFPTHDGRSPSEFRRIFRENVLRYPEVRFQNQKVLEVEKAGPLFRARLENGERVEARKLILATGVVDELPEIPGLKELWGDSVFHCPFCHGYEWADRAVGLIGPAPFLHHMVPFLRNITKDLVVFTNGPSDLSHDELRLLERNEIPFYDQKILSLETENGRLAEVLLEGGERVPRAALLLRPPQRPRSPFADQFGCRKNADGFYEVTGQMQTQVPGLFLVGDLVEPRQAVLSATWTGMNAGTAAAFELAQEDLSPLNKVAGGAF